MTRTTRLATHSLAFMVFASASLAQTPASAPTTPAQQAKADAGVQAFTDADVSFLKGMISHHSQAVVMAGWAMTHGASKEVKTLAGRIDVGQRDEIAFMQRWLADRHLDTAATHEGHDMSKMPGTSMRDSLTPGMLTPAQMAQLSAATGNEFDRLFLRFMIQHHEGALTMVDRLFSTPRAGQEEYVFRFASDVSSDQTTEIERMREMLAARTPQSNHQ